MTAVGVERSVTGDSPPGGGPLVTHHEKPSMTVARIEVC